MWQVQRERGCLLILNLLNLKVFLLNFSFWGSVMYVFILCSDRSFLIGLLLSP